MFFHILIPYFLQEVPLALIYNFEALGEGFNLGWHLKEGGTYVKEELFLRNFKTLFNILFPNSNK